MEKQQSENVLQQKEKHQRNAADLLVECLQEEGVEYIFGIPGEENLAVMNAIDQSPIRFITTRHEQGAAFMADVYGRLTGKAGVCLATLGPGATNLVTGVADADGDGAPLVAITGQVGTERMHITGHQFLDLTKMFEPITKRTKMVVRPDTVGEIVRLAFKYAESEKPGATHIDLPVNVAKMPVPEGEKPLHKKTAPKEYAELDTVQDAAGMIFQAKNPVILAGSGVVRGHASKELTEFATKLKIPVINTMMAKGINFSRIIDESFYRKTYVQNQIMGRAVLESVLFLEGKCIFSVVRKQDMDFYGVEASDLDGIVDQLRITEGVEVAIFLYETENHVYKVSMRSNNLVNVSQVAAYFGGGGHIRAAGCTMSGSVHDVINNLSALIEKQIKENEA